MLAASGSKMGLCAAAVPAGGSMGRKVSRTSDRDIAEMNRVPRRSIRSTSVGRP